MALTIAYRGLDQLKGGYQGNPVATPLHLVRFTINVSGTYATGGNTIDLCTPFVGPTYVTGTSPQGARMGVTAINVLWVQAFGDYWDGTTAATPETLTLTNGGSATSISAASTGNLVLVKLYTGTNGAGGSEVTNATALSGDYGLVAAIQLTSNGVS